MNRNELIEAQKTAAAALEAGQRMAVRAVARAERVQGVPEAPNAKQLGTLLGNPAAFWAGATACEAYGNEETVAQVALAVQLASARIACGDLTFARETLIGQSQWLGVVAVKLAERAGKEAKQERSASLWKLALAAQRQSAQTLASAAALNRLEASDGVTVKNDS